MTRGVGDLPPDFIDVLRSELLPCAIQQVALMEFHDVGPVKIFDTAGIDESGDLGSKKVSPVVP